MKKIFAILISVTVLFTACNSSSKEDVVTKQKVKKNTSIVKSDKLGGDLKINEPIFFNTLYPAKCKDAVSSHIISLINDGLLKYSSEDLKLKPAIAKRWKVDKTGLIYTFPLKTNVFFHDDKCFKNGEGRTVTASDFVFTFKQLCTKSDNNKNFIGAITTIEGAKDFYNGTGELTGVKAINDSTLQITLVKKNPLFVYFLVNPTATVIAKEAYKMYGISNTVGTGAFILSTYPDVNKPFTLTKNKNYYRTDLHKVQLPYLNSINISFIGATPKELNLFKEGKLNIVMGLPNKYITKFMEDNIDKFKGENPLYILDKSTEDANSELYNILSDKVIGFHTNRMNYIDLSIVYLKE